MKKYYDLLPSYLQGPNIIKHSQIITEQDNIIDEKIKNIQNWGNLNRPILIERIQEEPGTCTLKIHINSQYPIKKITTINLFDGINESYTEDELVTERVFVKTAQEMVPPVMPEFTVKVETYEDNVTYERGYPENDVLENNNHDHDVYLDIIGALLGIPRRLYKELDYTQDVESYENTYPKYFTKQYVWHRYPGDLLTEDDYYYAKRINKFIKEYKTKLLPVLMMELLYEWEDIQIGNLLQRTTSIASIYSDYIGTPTLILTMQHERYRNMDYTNMQDIINEYAPVTRPVLLSEPKELYSDYIDVEGTKVNDVTLNQIFNYIALPDEVEEGSIIYLPVKITFEFIEDGKTIQRYYKTDSNGDFNQSMVGLPPGPVRIISEPIAEYEFINMIDEQHKPIINVVIDNDLSIILNKWNYGLWNNYTGNVPVSPSNFDNQGYTSLDCGRGYLVFTPILDNKFGFNSSYKITIKFTYTTKYGRIGFGKLVESQNDGQTKYNIAKLLYLINYIDTSDYYTEHILDIQILNGVAYFFIDDTYINESYTVYNGLNYIAGYNTTIFNQIDVYKEADIEVPPPIK